MSSVRNLSPELQRVQTSHSWNISEIAQFDKGVWWLNDSPSTALSYPEEGNRGCAEIENESFWFSYRNLIIHKLFSRFSPNAALWDVGGGNGFVSKNIQDKGHSVVVVEPGPEGARKCAERGIEAVVCGRLEQLQLPSESVSALGAFDVIEHLEDPEEMLREFHRVLDSSGYLYLSVPAFSWLWSQADDFASHKQRFNKQTLGRLLKECGFEEVRSGYFMSLLVLPVYLLRVLPYKGGRRLSEDEMFNQLKCNGRSFLSKLLESLLALESIFIPNLSMPFGTSLYGVYRRKSAKSTAREH